MSWNQWQTLHLINRQKYDDQLKPCRRPLSQMERAWKINLRDNERTLFFSRIQRWRRYACRSIHLWGISDLRVLAIQSGAKVHKYMPTDSQWYAHAQSYVWINYSHALRAWESYASVDQIYWDFIQMVRLVRIIAFDYSNIPWWNPCRYGD